MLKDALIELRRALRFPGELENSKDIRESLHPQYYTIVLSYCAAARGTIRPLFALAKMKASRALRAGAAERDRGPDPRGRRGTEGRRHARVPRRVQRLDAAPHARRRDAAARLPGARSADVADHGSVVLEAAEERRRRQQRRRGWDIQPR